MTDEERQLICAVLRQVGGYWYRHPDGSTRDCGKEAAEEIERLADERDQFVEQLAIRSESGMAKDMQEIMRINNEQADEIKRLAAENKKLRDDFEWDRHVDGVRRRKHYT